MRCWRWLSKATLVTSPSTPPEVLRASARYSKLSNNRREVSTDHGTTRALSNSDTPQKKKPANHSTRVVRKIFSPAARIAVISLFRCSLLSTKSNESSSDNGSTMEK